MILVAVGANLPAPGCATPLESAVAGQEAVAALPGVEVLAASPWYRSAAVGGPPGQPDYINGVLCLESRARPTRLLEDLHGIEARFGRARRQGEARNLPRPLDLDLIDWQGRVRGGPGAPVLPHPRAHLRGFVLLPLRDVAPGWRHPVSGRAVDDLIADLPAAGLPVRLD